MTKPRALGLLGHSEYLLYTISTLHLFNFVVCKEIFYSIKAMGQTGN